MTTTPPARPRSSRRSHPNLHHLSLTQLSTNPITSPEDDNATESHTHSSYIYNSSVPTTPSVLTPAAERAPGSASLSKRARRAFIHDGDFLASGPTAESEPLAARGKAKSSSALLPAGLSGMTATITATNVSNPANNGKGGKRHHRRSKTAEAPDPDWLTRTGLLLSSNSKDAKGQSWLTSRAASTASLTDAAYKAAAEYQAQNPQGQKAVDMARVRNALLAAGVRSGAVTPRAGSHRSSARASRRGSTVALGDDYFGHVTPPNGSGLEPDFVDEEDEVDEGPLNEREVEEEIARLAREEGGIGGLMQKLMGWSLFRVEEDGESDDEDEDETEQAEPERRRRRQERVDALLAQKEAGTSVPVPPSAPEEKEGGWGDAAWLLSVASKVLL
jgi:hypothetical protein